MNKKVRGFSLLEVLVVLAVFSLLAIVSTSALLLAIRGTKKSDASARVRENVDFTLATIERQLRNATSIVSCTPEVVTFNDRDFNQTSFSCVNIGQEDSYIASGSARLTASEVVITGCQFTCTTGDTSTPPTIKVDIMAKDKNTAGAESAGFNASTQIILRTY